MSGELETLFSLMFQAHPWHGIPAFGPEPQFVNAFIEIVPLDAVKYELDKPAGVLRVDRPQRFSSACPTLYGFIPQTYCGDLVGKRCEERTGIGAEGDGDPLDVCVLSEKPFAHGNFVLRARPIGGLRMVDGNQADDKIIAVLESDLAYGRLQELMVDTPGAVIDRLRHYFLTYKQLPGEPRRVVIAEVYDHAEALEVIRLAQEDYRAKFGAPEGRIGQLKALLGRT